MATHTEFVKEFITAVQNSLGGDDDDPTNQALASASTAADARFAMGGDDDLYLTTALSLLHINAANDDKFPMAQPGLLKDETLNAVRRGVIACQKRERTERCEQAKAELPIIFKHFTGLKGVTEVVDFLEKKGKKLGLEVLNGGINYKDGSEESYRGMYEVFEAIDRLSAGAKNADSFITAKILGQRLVRTASVDAVSTLFRFAKAFTLEQDKDTEAFLDDATTLMNTDSDSSSPYGKAARAELRCADDVMTTEVSDEAAALRSHVIASHTMQQAWQSLELLESTGVPGVSAQELTRLLNAADAKSDTDPLDLSFGLDELRILLRHAMELTNLCLESSIKDEVEAALPTSSAPDKVAAIRKQFLRELSISTDKVWNFVRTVSGLIGEDANSLLETQDAEEEARAKQLQEAREAIAKRVTDFQAKVTELLFAGMLKDSKLALSTGEKAAESLVVVDAETRDKIEKLASGESGRPFFEANVALRNLTDCNESKPKSLANIVQQLAGVGEAMQVGLESQLLTSTSFNGMSTAALSRPQNSGFLRLRDDVVAAIRSAFDTFVTETRMRMSSRPVSLWELVEGHDHLLTRRFAELVGHLLVQNRSATGVSALYVPRAAVQTTALRANVALAKLLNQAQAYASRNSSPNFDGNRANYVSQKSRGTRPWAASIGYVTPPSKMQKVFLPPNYAIYG